MVKSEAVFLLWLVAIQRGSCENASWPIPTPVAVEDAALDDMQGILNWAIENSDHDALRNSAHAVRDGDLRNEVLEGQREHAQELIRLMSQQPTEVDLLKEALELLQAKNATNEQLSRALTAIKLLVESIDNANDMQALGGIGPVVSFLDRGPPFDGQAAHVLGTAASNNPVFQNHTVEAFPDVLDRLIKMTSSDAEESVSKAVYALSSFVRNLTDLRALFYAKGGLQALHRVLSRQPVTLNLERRCLSFLADLVSLDNVVIHDTDLLEVIMSKVDHDDLDIVEKALKLLILLQESPDSDKLLKASDIGSLVSRVKARIELTLSEDPGDTYLTEIIDLMNVVLGEEPSHDHIEL